MKFLPCLVSGLLLASCVGGDAGGGLETVRGSVSFDPGAGAEDLAALVEGDTAFALDLLRVGWDGDNLILSPFSIATALGMLAAGARGETRSEMAAVLHETLSEEALHPARGALLAAIAASDQSPQGEDPPPFRLRSVNSLWLQRDYPVLAAYLDTLAASYDAGLTLLDFVADPEGARRTINDAVAAATEDRIEELIPEGVITDLTRLVLTNAVYFKANWANEFDPAVTAPATFRLVDGTETTVPMMRTSATVDYVRGRGFVAAWLPYVGDASMMVLLPDGDIADLVANLTSEDLRAAREARLPHMLDLAMPRFEFRSQLTLAPLLRELGMQAAFVPPPGPASADLTGITETRELYVQDVVHEGFVKVDEKGTEAAAATAIVVGVTSLPPSATLHLDRPFLFLISHEGTGEVLFAGVVAQP